MPWLKKIINGLLYENDQLSLTRVLAISGWLAFLFVSFYLVYKGIGWQNYETFASLTGGGGAATQIANKFINSKYNSQVGQPLDMRGDKQ